MQLNYEKRIFGLDIMRAVAIIMVVCSHTLWIAPNTRGIIRDVFSVWGGLGVDIFFVLSGFLIGRIVLKLYTAETFSFKTVLHFWVRRWFRTLPNYYLALLLNVLVLIYVGNQLPDGFWKYGFFLHNFNSQLPWFFPESWSLSVEEFAYILGPLLLYLALFVSSKTPRPKLFLIVTVSILGLFLISKLIYNEVETIRDMRHWSSHVKSIVIYRIDAIYYGVLAAYISIVKPGFWKKIRHVSFIMSIVLLLGINVLIPIKQIFITEYPAFWNVWYFIMKSVIIAMALPLLSQIKTAPAFILKPITYISILSYAIYVLHYSIIMQLLKFYIPSETLVGFDLFVYIVVYVLLVLVISYFFYILYERPMTNLRDSNKIKNHFK